MTQIIFEHPLNEKIRSYLRLEYLAQQLQDNLNQDHQERSFKPLFSLCELLERCDYRAEVLKDLDKQLSQLSDYDVSLMTSIEDPIHALNESRLKLKMTERPGLLLKQDRFLTTLRQRYNMPGACCTFDLPQLHFWLQKPWSERQLEYQAWTAHFSELLSSVKLLLAITRQQNHYEALVANDGFYQAQSHIPLSLLRIKLNTDPQSYPTISGHKNRYAIHFMAFNTQKHIQENIPFQLAACP